MHDIDWDLLHRYLAGEATLEERARFEAWRDTSPDRRRMVSALLRATAEPPAVPLLTARDQAETWERLQRTITGDRDGVRLARRFVLGRPRRVPARAAAAAVAAVLIGAAAFGVIQQGREGQRPAVAEAERVLHAPRGQRATFQLPDGTRIVLGPESTLRYATSYGQRRREVRVEGEAYFAVKHDGRHPFVVRAADWVVQDLGTEFVVRAYPEDPRAIVAVREGEVGVRAASAVDETARVVSAGEFARLSGGADPVVTTVELDPYFAWINGRLVFDETPLREALPRLSRWFDLDLRLADSALGEIPVTASFDHRPTADVIGNMAAALGLVSVRDGRVVYLRRPAAGN